MKRILVISNIAFSKENSNGRTMENLLLEYDKAALAQFYIHGKADTDFCNHYFCVSDRDALHAFLHKKKEKTAKAVSASVSGGVAPVVHSEKKIKSNCRNLLLRNIIWRSYAWWDQAFSHFLREFSPQVVLLQAGDAPFMYAIAQKIAKKFDAALVMYNSENYVLKRYIYNGAQKEGLWHTLLQRSLKKQYKCFMRDVDFCIYSTEQLEADYQMVYPHAGKSTALYTVSDLQPGTRPVNGKNDVFRLVYCGNLGVGRIMPLKELAEVLYKVDAGARLEIYGRFGTEREQEYVCSVPNVDYRGLVEYSLVPDILRGADMIVHCENKKRLQDLWAAFSTKIADSLAIGTPFLVFADRAYPFVKYLQRNDCAHIAGDAGELEEVLTKCRDDIAYRNRVIENALKTARENHSADNNCCKLNEIIEKL